MSLDIIPTKIGHFVVECYDPNSNSIDLGHTKLIINEEKIHQVLGLPKRGVDLSTVKECEEQNEVYHEWKRQHPTITSQQVICDLIEASTFADEMFVMNFFTLFVNSMIEKTRSRGIETRVTRKLLELYSIHEINWCKYINDTLKHSKAMWKPNNANSYYAGPLPFLVVSKHQIAFIFALYNS